MILAVIAALCPPPELPETPNGGWVPLLAAATKHALANQGSRDIRIITMTGPHYVFFPEQVVTQACDLASPNRKVVYSTQSEQLRIEVPSIIDGDHVHVESLHKERNNRWVVFESRVYQRRNRQWFPVKNDITKSERRAILQEALLTHLRVRNAGTFNTDYVGVIDDEGPTDFEGHRAKDPSDHLMEIFWSKGWSVKQISYVADGHPHAKHPRHEYCVGDVVRVDSNRVMVEAFFNIVGDPDPRDGTTGQYLTEERIVLAHTGNRWQWQRIDYVNSYPGE